MAVETSRGFVKHSVKWRRFALGKGKENFKSIAMPYGETMVRLDVPEDRVLEIVEPRPVAQRVRESALIGRALDRPCGSERLADLAAAGQKTAIVVSDITRPCPTKRLLPPLLKELYVADIGDQAISIVFALGAHRQQSAKEQMRLVGEEIFSRVECIDSDPHDFVYLGETSRGTPVEVFRPVAEAQLLICVGNIELHHFAGYSGGAKAILPGVSSVRSITQNHAMWMQYGTAAAKAGKLEGNPVREDMEEAGQMAGLDFILNAIVDASGTVLQAVAGDPYSAHRRGCAYVDALNKISISKHADIVLVSPGGYPKDISLFQAQKALDFAVYAVKKGGTIILLAECREGMGDLTFEAWMREAASPNTLLKRIGKEFALGGDKAASISLVMKRASIYLVSSLPPQVVQDCWKMPGLRHFGSIDDALEMAFAEQGTDAKIAIMPQGNSTLPILQRAPSSSNSS